jgi:hypothetical protein
MMVKERVWLKWEVKRRSFVNKPLYFGTQAGIKILGKFP